MEIYRKLFILVLVLLSTITVFSQESSDVVHPKKITIKKIGQFAPRNAEYDWDIKLQNLEMPDPNGHGLRSELLRKKAELRKKYPIKHEVSFGRSTGDESLISSVAKPEILKGMEGNPFASSVPNDNDIAVSNEGKIISVINKTVMMYDSEADSLLNLNSLANFVQSLGFYSRTFDPKVVYDPIQDRFVLVFLNGTLFFTSKVIICFSSTNDPMDSWNLYELVGNPLDNATWSDYPVIGISENDLYIGVNTFTNGSVNNSGFVEACLWQVGMESGYKGAATLATNYYSDILQEGSPLFNICPIKGGSQPYGPNMYLLSNRSLSTESNIFFLLEVTNSVKSGIAEMRVNEIYSKNNYFLPSEARQANGHTFDMNDSRVLGGFYENGSIQFVQSCLDTTTGLGGIYHGFILDVGGKNAVYGEVIGDSIKDLGFPNISMVGYNLDQNECIITFNHSSPIDYSGFSSIFFSNIGAYSPIQMVKEGEGYVDVLFGTYERWGDYSGSQSNYADLNKIWASGSFGTSSNENSTWLAELSVPNIGAPATSVSIGIYPNPVRQYGNIEFEMEKSEFGVIELFSLEGKKLRTLYEDVIKKGENRLSFRTDGLSAGTYIIRIVTNSNQIRTSKLIVR